MKNKMKSQNAILRSSLISSLKLSLCFICLTFTYTNCFSHEKNEKNNQKHIIKSDKAPKAIGPYSQAIKADDFLYTSGQIAINPETNLMDTANFKLEVTRVMSNLEEILVSAKMNWSNVVKCTVYLSDLSNFAEFNEIYAQYFKENPPARETVEVKKLPKNAHIEISLVAFKDED